MSKHAHTIDTHRHTRTQVTQTATPARYSKQGPEWSEGRNTKARETETNTPDPLIYTACFPAYTHIHTLALIMIAQSPRLICEIVEK